MSLASHSVDGNVIFFLLHELPHHLEGMEGFTCERRTVFFGNFQVIVATRVVTASKKGAGAPTPMAPAAGRELSYEAPRATSRTRIRQDRIETALCK